MIWIYPNCRSGLLTERERTAMISLQLSLRATLDIKSQKCISKYKDQEDTNMNTRLKQPVKMSVKNYLFVKLLDFLSCIHKQIIATFKLPNPYSVSNPQILPQAPSTLSSKKKAVFRQIIKASVFSKNFLLFFLRERFIEEKKEKTYKCQFCPYTYLRTVKTDTFPFFLQ